MTRVRRAVVVTVVAATAALLVGGLSWWTQDASVPAVTAPTTVSDPTVSLQPSVTATTVPVDAHNPATTVKAGKAGDPVRVRLPARHIDAPVDLTGIADSGTMEVPSNVARIGWTGAVQAGAERGATLLAGHVDSAKQGRGAFWSLREVHAGDTVLITTRAGAALSYVVDGVIQENKGDLPAFVSAEDGPHRLVLVTCGGSFRDGHYTQNVIVTARLTTPSH